MAQERVEVYDGRKEDHVSNTVAVDRLSALPDAIIHHILSFLPTLYAVRMSLVSKCWRQMWCSLPALSFPISVVNRNFDTIKLNEFVRRCLELRRIDMLNVTDRPITIFKLSMITWGGSWSMVDGWLTLVSNSKVKVLDLHIGSIYHKRYPLPMDILNLRSLTHLRLCYVELKDLHSICLPSLVSLYLDSVVLDDLGLHDLLLACCSLQKLTLKACINLSNPEIPSLNIKSLEIVGDHKYVRRRVGGQTVTVKVCPDFRFCHSSYEMLSNLSFTRVRFNDQQLEDLIPRLPFLENLTLCNCEGLKHVKIGSQNLKQFTLERNGDHRGVEATVDSPNLVYFSYEGFLKSNFSINPQNLLEAKIRLDKPSTSYDTEWYTNLSVFLSNLNCSKNLSLDVDSEEALIFPEELRTVHHSPLPALKHLKVKTHSPSSRDANLRDSLSWVSPSLETLSIE